MAENPRVPVRSRMARSSPVLRAPAPRCCSLSRGLSCGAISRMSCVVMVGYHIGFDLVLQQRGDVGDDLDKISLVAHFKDATGAMQLGNECGEVIGKV